MNNPSAPIALFVYKRLDTLQQVISALQKNTLASGSRLFIFSDAAKSEKDGPVIQGVRTYLKGIQGFRSIQIFEATHNKGLANSIIEGVTRIINEYGKVIVLEDDLVTSPNFLNYMNQALDYYAENPSVFSVSGFSMPMKGLGPGDVYFTLRGSSWGWATWKDRWALIDWEMKDYGAFTSNAPERKAIRKMGSDILGLLDKQVHGKIDSWAVRWNYHQFKQRIYSVFPATSKVSNIGFADTSATHTRERFSRYKTKLDGSNSTHFNFTPTVGLDKKIIRQYVRPYSLQQRALYKLINHFF